MQKLSFLGGQPLLRADLPANIAALRRRSRGLDLGALLDAIAGAPVVISVLDDLSNPSLGPGAVIEALHQLRGRPSRRPAEPDPHSLPTLRRTWGDGLEVAGKDHHLGEVAPWSACERHPVRSQCREGLWALRLSPDGVLLSCMDRPDLSLPLSAIAAATGPRAAEATWRCAVAGWTRAPARHAA